MEKPPTSSKLRPNLRTKRKFSLPLFLNYFHQEVAPVAGNDPANSRFWDAVEDPKLPPAAPVVGAGGSGKEEEELPLPPSSPTPMTSLTASIVGSFRAIRFRGGTSGGSSNDDGSHQQGSKPVSRQSTRSSSTGSSTRRDRHRSADVNNKRQAPTPTTANVEPDVMDLGLSESSSAKSTVSRIASEPGASASDVNCGTASHQARSVPSCPVPAQQRRIYEDTSMTMNFSPSSTALQSSNRPEDEPVACTSWRPNSSSTENLDAATGNLQQELACQQEEQIVYPTTMLPGESAADEPDGRQEVMSSDETSIEQPQMRMRPTRALSCDATLHAEEHALWSSSPPNANNSSIGDNNQLVTPEGGKGPGPPDILDGCAAAPAPVTGIFGSAIRRPQQRVSSLHQHHSGKTNSKIPCSSGAHSHTGPGMGQAAVQPPHNHHPPPVHHQQSLFEAPSQRRVAKLRRRPACYRQRRPEDSSPETAHSKKFVEGRSKSLTHIDSLDPRTEVREESSKQLHIGDSRGHGSGMQQSPAAAPSGDGSSVSSSGAPTGASNPSSSSGAAPLFGGIIGGPPPPKNSFQNHDMHHLRGFHAAIQSSTSSSGGFGGTGAPNETPSSSSGGGESGGGTAVTAIKQRSRRTKLASSMKVCSSEFFTVIFDLPNDCTGEEILPASRGCTLRDSLRPLCSKRGISNLDTVLVYNESWPTPLSLETESCWLGGKHLKITVREKGQADSSSSTRSAWKGGHKNGRFFNSSAEDMALGSSSSTLGPGGTGGKSLSSSMLCSSLSAEMLDQQSGTSPSNKGSESTGSFKAKSKQLTRWGGIFGNSKEVDRMEELVEQLNQYDKHGIPPLNAESSSLATEQEDFRLESDWTAVVPDASRLTERKRQQQTAIWELIQTEAAYIETIEVITKLFMACLVNLQKARILVDIDVNRLFSNMPDILSANVDFWRRVILPMLDSARATKQPLDPSHLKMGFCTLDQWLQPYTKYCLEQTGCQQYCRERDQENEMFKAYLAWCETQKDCNRLRLQDLLVKPMQRITKYPLLLKVILKYSDEDYEREDLNLMVNKTEQFVTAINSALRHRQEQIRLEELSNKIASYEVLDAKDEELQKLIRKYSDMDLTCPMIGLARKTAMIGSPPSSGKSCGSAALSQIRVLLHEGDLKLRDSTSSKMDVHCFLFTDVLLICKMVSGGKTSKSSAGAGSSSSSAMVGMTSLGTGSGGDSTVKYKVVRQPFLVERLVVKEMSGGRDSASFAVVYLSEFRTAVAAFILQASDAKSSRIWCDCLRKAHETYAEAKVASLSRSTGSGFLSRTDASFTDGSGPVMLSTGMCTSTDGPGGSGGIIPTPQHQTSICSVPSFASDDGDLLGGGQQHLLPSAAYSPARSPAPSSRPSRGSSLARSHSGSVEIQCDAGSDVNDASIASRPGVRDNGHGSIGPAGGSTFLLSTWSSASSDEGQAGVVLPADHQQAGQMQMARSQYAEIHPQAMHHQGPVIMSPPRDRRSNSSAARSQCTLAPHPTMSLPASPHLSPGNQPAGHPPSVPPGASHLSVHMAYSLPAGQSMPDLPGAGQRQLSNTLSIPNYGGECERPTSPAGAYSSSARMLSPTSRGISYPPPSPRSLKRGMPVPQSRFPPLRKGDRVAASMDACRTLIPPQPAVLAAMAQQVSQAMMAASDMHHGDRHYEFSGELGMLPERTSSPMYADEMGSHEDRLGPSSTNFSNNGGGGRNRRPVRAEERRYLTAGAVEDIKRQSTKDSSIHKRLSLNYSNSGNNPGSTTRGMTMAGSGSSELMCRIMERDDDGKLMLGAEHGEGASGHFSSSGIGSSTSCSSTCSLQSTASQSNRQPGGSGFHQHDGFNNNDNFGPSSEESGLGHQSRYLVPQGVPHFRESAGLFQNPMLAYGATSQPDVIPHQALMSSQSEQAESAGSGALHDNPSCSSVFQQQHISPKPGIQETSSQGESASGGPTAKQQKEDLQPALMVTEESVVGAFIRTPSSRSPHMQANHQQQHHVSTTYITLDKADQDLPSSIYVSSAGPSAMAAPAVMIDDSEPPKGSGDAVLQQQAVPEKPLLSPAAPSLLASSSGQKPGEVRISVSDESKQKSSDAMSDKEEASNGDDSSAEAEHTTHAHRGLEFILNSNVESSDV